MGLRVTCREGLSLGIHVGKVCVGPRYGRGMEVRSVATREELVGRWEG